MEINHNFGEPTKHIQHLPGHIHTKTQTATTSTSHVTAIHVIETMQLPNCTYMPYILWARMADIMHICATYEVICISHMTKNTVHILCELYFILLTYLTDQIWLPHGTLRSHYLHAVWEYRPYTCTHVLKHNQI